MVVAAVPTEPLESRLRRAGPARDAALAELHELLLKGAHHELARRGWRRADAVDMAQQAADEALAAIVRKLDDFRGESRFTTWAYKFVLLEAGVRARRRAWESREVKLEDESWRRLADPAPTAERTVEESELLRAIAAAMGSDLTVRQREVLTALALDEVPIDVLAERLGSTRGALYKTLHDARRKLRAVLTERGYSL
jgi:RNA polymerase sigma-70 factor (ECF subfamily)